jgi:hypothetical protein
MKKENLLIIMFAGLMAAATGVSCTKETIGEHSISAQAQTDPASNIIGITNTGYTKPDHWSGKDQPVIWINNDNKSHSVTADDASFDSGPIPPGGSYTKEFSRPGVYTYHDSFSSAKATISIFGREDP